mmetsp:Transcript_20940/g.59186  ORF Transcript_20940/g.59186 Transcript_20940/m.59186 type:complete len:206 (+) Transcript_20940:452-1069(+)
MRLALKLSKQRFSAASHHRILCEGSRSSEDSATPLPERPWETFEAVGPSSLLHRELRVCVSPAPPDSPPGRFGTLRYEPMVVRSASFKYPSDRLLRVTSIFFWISLHLCVRLSTSSRMRSRSGARSDETSWLRTVWRTRSRSAFRLSMPAPPGIMWGTGDTMPKGSGHWHQSVAASWSCRVKSLRRLYMSGRKGGPGTGNSSQQG